MCLSFDTAPSFMAEHLHLYSHPCNWKITKRKTDKKGRSWGKRGNVGTGTSLET